jgi:hypothetical protein
MGLGYALSISAVNSLIRSILVELLLIQNGSADHLAPIIRLLACLIAVALGSRDAITNWTIPLERGYWSCAWTYSEGENSASVWRCTQCKTRSSQCLGEILG